MTYMEAKEKLHNYIEHADEKKIMDMLSLFEDTIESKGSGSFYDDITINILKERSESYLSGKSKTSTWEESLQRIQSQRQKK